MAAVSRLRNLGGNDLLFPVMGTSKPCPRGVTVRDEERRPILTKSAFIRVYARATVA